ncbi:enoyl-CoA hydratase/isomerase family protein [Amycolatopsis benzoatilytica]|uniref:enoyl-CoA hydratase/isomerase family protein n=1 Tax=Amycolatopsis benzoatilytica TaxID=346045 RepID=UPI000364C1B1|nr:enoyl-CoA hydratase-related protein [Amycolatopsis benzoatilytica]
MSAELVRYRTEDDIAVLTINRPEASNALNAATREQLLAALAAMDADAAVRVGVLTGAGERAFCAGGDLRELGEDPEPMRRFVDRLRVRKPLIAAVNGVAYGAGFLLLQVCDLCVSSTGARFAVPEVKLGRSLSWAAGLPWLLPPRAVMELLLTGDPIGAERAYELGLVNAVVPPGDLLGEACALARRVAAGAPLTALAAKQMVRLSSAVELRQMAAELAALWQPVLDSADAQEGIEAFQARRPARWSGR